MLRKMHHRAAHKADVNWAPLSEVRVAGTPSQDGDPAGEDGSVAVGGGDGGKRAGTVGTPSQSQ
jgi:hypothetical protein